MKVINPHSLLVEGNNYIDTNEVILKIYNVYKKLLDNKKLLSNDFDSFVAGYFLGTNSILKEKYLEKSKEIKSDFRYN